MAGRKDIEAGAAYVRLYVENSALQKGLRAAAGGFVSFGATIAKIGGTIAGLGATIYTPLTAMAYGFAKTSTSSGARNLASAISVLEKQLGKLSNTLGAAMAPQLTQNTQLMSRMVAGATEWAKANQPLIATVGTIAGMAVGAGTAIASLGGVFAGVGAGLGVLSKVLTTVVAGVSLLFTPIGGLVTVLGLGTAALIAFTDTGRWLAETLVGDMGSAFNIVWDMIGGITDALSAGDIALAAQLAVKGLKLAFFEGTKTIRDIWIQFNKTLVDVFVGAGKTIIGIVQTICNKINEAYGGLQIFLREGLTATSTYENDKLDAERRGLKAKRRSGAITEEDYAKQMRALAARTQGKLEDDASRNNDIFGSTADRTKAIDAIAGDWGKSLDEFGKATQENLDADAAAGGERIDRLKQEFGGLRERARAEAKPFEAPIEKGKGAGVAVTFSAAAAQALGRGGGPMERLLAVAEQQKQIADKQLKANVDSGMDLKKLLGLLTIS